MKGPLTFDIQADELEIFVQDVNDHLQAMEAGILRLERAADAETLNAVFRAAHTLKAVAATVGHHAMADLTHTLETLFDRMRQQETAPTPALADELLGTVDVLKALRDEVITRQPSGIDVAARLERLRVLAEQVASPERPADAPPAPAPVAQQVGADRLAPEQADQAREYALAGYTLFEAHVQAAPDTFAPAARLLQAAMALLEVGEVIAQHPSQDDLLEDRHEGRLWFLLATQAGQEAVEELLSDVTDLAEFHVGSYTMDEEPEVSNAPDARPSSAVAPASAGEDKMVRISVERLDMLMNLVGELVTDRTRLVQISDTLRARYIQEKARQDGETVGALSELTTHFNRVVDQLQEEVMQARMLPIAQLFQKLPRLVRDAARAAGKQVDLVIKGEATELDRSVIEAIGDPLMHLLRNAVSHGIESPAARSAAGKAPTGTVWLTAAHEEGHIVITVRDDGRGVDPDRTRQAAVRRGLLSEDEVAQLDDDQAINLIFRPNLSTAEQVTGVSGRGVGLDVVQTNVKRLGGSAVVESEVGRGTTIRVTLPLTLAILQTMLVALGDDVYAIPLAGVIESLYLADVSVGSAKGVPIVRWRNRVLPLLSMRQFFDHPELASAPSNGARQAIVVVAWGKLRAGLVVDKLIGKQEIVVKSLSPIVGNVTGLSGCTVLGNGRVALIVDIPGLISSAMQAQRQG